jgi:hypothetical protein
MASRKRAGDEATEAHGARPRPRRPAIKATFDRNEENTLMTITLEEYHRQRQREGRGW